MVLREPSLGVLMLAGKMADVPGCMACEETFPYPVVRKVVEGSRTPRSLDEVRHMLPKYQQAAQELEREGVDVITANCGLVALLQQELSAVVRVPVVTSALLMVPAVSRAVGGRTVGVLTFFADEVGERNFQASGWSSADIPTRVAGVGQHPSWLRFLETKEMDSALRLELAADLIATAEGLVAEVPDVGAFVLECTMLPSLSGDLRDHFDIPVYDVLTLIDWAMSGYERQIVRRTMVTA